MGTGETVAIIVMTVCIAAPTIITQLKELVSGWQSQRIKKLEKEIEELKRK